MLFLLPSVAMAVLSCPTVLDYLTESETHCSLSLLMLTISFCRYDDSEPLSDEGDEVDEEDEEEDGERNEDDNKADGK